MFFLPCQPHSAAALHLKCAGLPSNQQKAIHDCPGANWFFPECRFNFNSPERSTNNAVLNFIFERLSSFMKLVGAQIDVTRSMCRVYVQNPPRLSSENRTIAAHQSRRFEEEVDNMQLEFTNVFKSFIADPDAPQEIPRGIAQAAARRPPVIIDTTASFASSTTSPTTATATIATPAATSSCPVVSATNIVSTPSTTANLATSSTTTNLTTANVTAPVTRYRPIPASNVTAPPPANVPRFAINAVNASDTKIAPAAENATAARFAAPSTSSAATPDLYHTGSFVPDAAVPTLPPPTINGSHAQQQMEYVNNIADPQITANSLNFANTESHFTRPSAITTPMLSVATLRTAPEKWLYITPF